MHRHTAPAPGIIVWGCIGFHCHTPLVRIAGTLNSQRYISEMLAPVVLQYLHHPIPAINRIPTIFYTFLKLYSFIRNV
ncbi:UNVERIFIED_CONTAM: hypothetical protein NCL1_38468 [Trichonephila clavipes]